MDKNSHKVRHDRWLQILTECNNRDQSISKTQWCQINGINIKSFYYWQRQFRNELLVLSKSSSSNVPAFVDITSDISSQVSTKAVSIVQKDASIEKTLIPELMIQSGDFRVYVSGTVQEQTLDTVIKVLRRA